MNKLRYLIPNSLTAISFLLGVWAILFASGFLESPLESKTAVILGCHLVMYCVLLDKLDGFAASALNASSEFGAQFDSLADLVAFGIAPAFCLLFAYKEFVPLWYAEHTIALLLCLSLYVICAAIRLARYNATDAEASSDWFVGLPSTLAGGINIAIVIITHKYGFFHADNALLYLPLLALAISGLLMLSPLYLPKVKVRESKIVNAFQLTGIATGYAFGFAMIYSEYILFLAGSYTIIGLIVGLIIRNQINEANNMSAA